MLGHRLQVLLEEGQYRELEDKARRSGTSVASIIRQAIDHRLHDDWERRRLAWERIVAAEPVPVPDDPQDLKREYFEDRARRIDALGSE